MLIEEYVSPEFWSPSEVLNADSGCEVRESGQGPFMVDPGFRHGWNPLPTAASASGGGLLLLILLH